MTTFHITATTPDGQSESQTITAADEGKAKTEFMAFATIKPRGQFVTFAVREVQA